MIYLSTITIFVCGLSLVLAEDQDALFNFLLAFTGPSFRYKANNSNAILTMPDDMSNLRARQLCYQGQSYCSGISLIPSTLGALTEISHEGGCIPSGTTCCPGYYCPSDAECCPGNSCAPSGAQCCEGDSYCPSPYACCYSNCMPSGAVCCPDGNWCPAGNECIIITTTGNHVCCTNPHCTAYVAPNGVTISGAADQGSYYISLGTRPVPSPLTTPVPATPMTTTSEIQSITSAPTTPQPTQPVYQFYYWTFTWQVYPLKVTHYHILSNRL
jgi:hypothetical protein